MLKKKGKTKVLTVQSGIRTTCACTYQCRCTVAMGTRERAASFNASTQNNEYGIDWS